MILFELALEAGQQGKCVPRSSGETGEYLPVVKAAHFFGAGLHHGLAHRHLSVPGKRDLRVFTHKQDCGAAHFVFFPHVYLISTIGIRFKLSQGGLAQGDHATDLKLGYHTQLEILIGKYDNMQRRPRIGITMRIEQTTNRFYLGRHYSEAVAAAGGIPLHISLIPDATYIDAVVADLDGVLLPGSDSDVDPFRYGQDPHPKLGTVQPIKDETDLLVIEAVERLNLPLFAICFGMQVLNVARGGTLIQDIGDQVPRAIKHDQGAPRDRWSHGVRLLPDSQIAAVVENEKLLVNSHHHQAVENVGNNLIPTAWSNDGLIEALEDPRADRYVVAVQWHPELGWERDEASQQLFGSFITAAAQHVKAKHQVLDSISV